MNTAKTAELARSFASSGNDVQEILVNPESTRKQTKKRTWRNETKLKAKQSDHVIEEITSSASKPSAEKETMVTTKQITTIETMPTMQAEQLGETTNNSPPPRQWGTLDDHLLAMQCPMPGEQGATCFRGKEILEFLMNWERMANKYRLSMTAKIDFEVDYYSPEMKNTVNAMMSMAKRKMRDETQATREKSQWKGFKTRAFEQYRSTDSVQICLMGDYLKALTAKRDVWSDEGEGEYNINEFNDVVVELVKMR